MIEFHDYLSICKDDCINFPNHLCKNFVKFKFDLKYSKDIITKTQTKYLRKNIKFVLLRVISNINAYTFIYLNLIAE